MLKTLYIAAMLLIVAGGCVSRPPSPFEGLSPTRSRILARQNAQAREAELEADLQSAFADHPPLNVLVLSGGDAHGAFGCGVLGGWRDCVNNPRPTFDVVTGVSTGALMATFAFLGQPQDDAVLRDVYLNIRDKDAFAGPISGPPDALFDTAPLRQLIAAKITADTLRRIAIAHEHGRRLYVATVEMDTGELIIWPMSRLANDAVSKTGDVDAAKLERFRAILLAAASIPVLFPPVEIDGQLHVDAGLRAALILEEPMLGTTRPSSSDIPTVWAIFNGKLTTTPQPVTEDFANLGIRSLEIYTHAVEMLSMREIAYMSAAHNPPFRFQWICEPATDRLEPTAPGLIDPMFDPAATRPLYKSGEILGKNAAAWKSGPPS